MARIRRFLLNEEAATAVEYAVMLGLILFWPSLERLVR